MRTTPAAHEELKEIGRGCITRHHAHHYFGFAETQWKLFEKESPRRVKPLLYVYRVLLTGIHLMQTGEVEANLATLNEKFRLSYVPELIARKLAGPEASVLPDADIAFHRAEYERLRGELQSAFEATSLPEFTGAREELSDLLCACVPARPCEGNRKMNIARIVVTSMVLAVAPSPRLTAAEPASQPRRGDQVAASLQPFVDRHTLAGAVTLVADKEQGAEPRGGRIFGHRRQCDDAPGRSLLDRLHVQGNDGNRADDAGGRGEGER